MKLSNNSMNCSPTAAKSIRSETARQRPLGLHQCSTPTTQQLIQKSKVNDSSLLSNSIKASTKEASVNTPTAIDLSFQLHALTERCITLENRLIKE